MIQGFMVGRLGKDAELHYTKAGDPVCSFSIACQNGFGDRAKTIWIDCSLWGDRAKSLTQYLLKGKEISVQGELDVRAWNSNSDSEPHATIQLNVRELALHADGKNRTAAA